MPLRQYNVKRTLHESRHRQFNLEKKILLLFPPGLELETLDHEPLPIIIFCGWLSLKHQLTNSTNNLSRLPSETYKYHSVVKVEQVSYLAILTFCLDPGFFCLKRGEKRSTVKISSSKTVDGFSVYIDITNKQWNGTRPVSSKYPAAFTCIYTHTQNVNQKKGSSF